MVNDGPERSFLETLSGGKATTTRFCRVPPTHRFYRTVQVAIARNDQRGVEDVVLSVAQQLDRDVNVGHFLFVGTQTRSALAAGPLLWQEVSEVDCQVRESLQGLQVAVLALRLVRVARFGNHAGREIANGHQLLSGAQQALHQPVQV